MPVTERSHGLRAVKVQCTHTRMVDLSEYGLAWVGGGFWLTQGGQNNRHYL